MFNVIFYNSELKYQKNREDLFLKLANCDIKNKYIYVCIDNLDDYNFEIDLKDINCIFLYPRQLKTINLQKNIYKTIINNSIKKIIYIDDIRNKYNNYDQYLVEYLNNFNVKLMPYFYLVNKYLIRLNNSGIVNCRHYINNQFIPKDINNFRNIQISILGHYRHDTYKTRKYIMRNSKEINSKLINCIISCFIKPLNETSYFDILNKSYVSIATTGDNSESYLPYLVSKYFEIPGCGCLLIAHILPELEEEMKECGFIENINYIKFTTIEDLINKCNYIFHPDNKETIEKIRINGYNLIINNHTIKHRQEQIIKLINI